MRRPCGEVDTVHWMQTLDANAPAGRRRGHLPRASTVLPVLPHEMLAARVSDPTMFFLGWKMAGWIMALTAAGTRSHANKSILTGCRPRLGSCCVSVQDERKIGPTIFDRDATDNDIVGDVAKANFNVNNIVGALPLCDKQARHLFLD